MMIARIVFLLGTFFRNREIFSKYRFLKKSEKWSIHQLEQYQFEKAKELITWAYEKSPFYKTLFDKNGLTPSSFRSLEDLKKFPIITKQDLIDHNDEILIKDGFNKLIFSETSGSSGQVLTFYRNKEWDAAHRSAMFRGYSWYGVKPWDRNGYFWGYNIDPKKRKIVKFYDFLLNRFRIFSYKEKDILKFAKKLEKADYLEGYSSMIYEVAKIINEKGLSNKYHLKMIKGTAEKIYPKYQEASIKAFGKKIISEYGSAEAGIIAFECPEGGNMHITMENLIVEEINGEAVITNLESKSFPLIRYKLNDYIQIDRTTKCPCGRQHYIISEILGRVGKPIYGKKEIYPSLTLYYIFKNIALNHHVNLTYQGIQTEKGKLQINIEQIISDYERSLIDHEIKKYFGDDIEYSIQDGQLRRTQTAKLKEFISEIPE
jgi:phenylacetate-CoA ligase